MVHPKRINIDEFFDWAIHWWPTRSTGIEGVAKRRMQMCIGNKFNQPIITVSVVVSAIDAKRISMPTLCNTTCHQCKKYWNHLPYHCHQPIRTMALSADLRSRVHICVYVIFANPAISHSFSIRSFHFMRIFVNEWFGVGAAYMCRCVLFARMYAFLLVNETRVRAWITYINNTCKLLRTYVHTVAEPVLLNKCKKNNRNRTYIRSPWKGTLAHSAKQRTKHTWKTQHDSRIFAFMLRFIVVFAAAETTYTLYEKRESPFCANWIKIDFDDFQR